ncbi:MAG: glycosyltransferase family 4 protein [Bacteroidales bacterium]
MAKTRVSGPISRLTIAILTRAAYPWHGHGGLERHVYDLARHLMSRDVCVTLVTPPDKRTVPPSSAAQPGGVFDDPRFERRIVRYVTFPFAGRRGTTVVDRSTAYPLFGYRAGSVVAGMVARGEADVVYGLGAAALGYAQARRRGARAPFIFNPQGLEEFGATGDRTRAGGRGLGLGTLKGIGYAPLRAAVRSCARAADIVIATDHVLEPVVLRHLGVEPARVRVVPNAIDIDACDRLASTDHGRAMRARHSIADNEIVLLSVGRLEANKGFHVLAPALASLAREPRWRWVVVGEGPYRSAIEHAVTASRVRDRVLFAGRVTDPELHAWYEAATLFVHPTLYEGSSLVTLEAMAHRRPVVATLAGGLPDKVKPGVSGWLVEPGNVEALGAALREAVAARERLSDMGAEGRRTAETVFAWSHVADQFLALCTELVSGGDTARSPVS